MVLLFFTFAFPFLVSLTDFASLHSTCMYLSVYGFSLSLSLSLNCFQELSHLTQLVLSQNSMRVFPMEVSLCPALAELDISGNKAGHFYGPFSMTLV